MDTLFTDEYFMKQAMIEAIKAKDKGEVPVGAIVIANDTIIARAHNQTETLNDVTAHAEMQAITSAANYLGSKYLKKCTLYVTLEPCVMCAGALYWTQIDRLVFGAGDMKRGFLRINPSLLHPKTELCEGVLASESEQILKQFFKERR